MTFVVQYGLKLKMLFYLGWRHNQVYLQYLSSLSAAWFNIYQTLIWTLLSQELNFIQL